MGAAAWDGEAALSVVPVPVRRACRQRGAALPELRDVRGTDGHPIWMTAGTASLPDPHRDGDYHMRVRAGVIDQPCAAVQKAGVSVDAVARELGERMTIQIDDFYRSSNGDRWRLVWDTETGHRTVRTSPTCPPAGASLRHLWRMAGPHWCQPGERGAAGVACRPDGVSWHGSRCTAAVRFASRGKKEGSQDAHPQAG